MWIPFMPVSVFILLIAIMFVMPFIRFSICLMIVIYITMAIPAVRLPSPVI